MGDGLYRSKDPTNSIKVHRLLHKNKHNESYQPSHWSVNNVINYVNISHSVRDRKLHRNSDKVPTR